MKANVLYLSHGRKNPSDRLDEWGEEGPQLIIHGMHITYGCTYTVSPIIGNHNTLLTVREGCIYYDGMWYGDWGVFPLNADNLVDTVPFDPVLAEPSRLHLRDLAHIKLSNAEPLND